MTTQTKPLVRYELVLLIQKRRYRRKVTISTRLVRNGT